MDHKEMGKCVLLCITILSGKHEIIDLFDENLENLRLY